MDNELEDSSHNSVLPPMRPFVPKQRTISAKDAKLFDLYGDRATTTSSVGLPSALSEPPPYPLNKMEVSAPPAAQRSSYSRPAPCAPPEDPPRELWKPRQRVESPQHRYNRRLSEIRHQQPSFSDIFSVDNEDASLPSHPARRLLEPRRRNSMLELTARERYLSDLQADPFGLKHEPVAAAPPASRLVTAADAEDESRPVWLSLKPPCANAAAHILLVRLANLPTRITEDDLNVKVRTTGCRVVRIWLPTDPLTGLHKGFCSLIVRQPVSPVCERQPSTSSDANDATDDNPFTPSDPLQKYLQQLEAETHCEVVVDLISVER